MRSIICNIIRILLTSSVNCLKYPEALCTNLLETNTKCEFDSSVRVEDQPVFAHVVSE